MGGEYLMSLSAENRLGAGVSAGDEVEVEVQLDTEERVLALPDDFRRPYSVKCNLSGS